MGVSKVSRPCLVANFLFHIKKGGILISSLEKTVNQIGELDKESLEKTQYVYIIALSKGKITINSFKGAAANAKTNSGH